MKMIIWNKIGKIEYTLMGNGLYAEIDSTFTVRMHFQNTGNSVFFARCNSMEEAKELAEKKIHLFAAECFEEEPVDAEDAEIVEEPVLVEELTVEAQESALEKESDAEDTVKSLSIAYAPAEEGKYSVEIFAEYGDDFVVRYTTNGKGVTFRNKAYKDPIIVAAGTEVNAAVFDNDNIVVEECSIIVEG